MNLLSIRNVSKTYKNENALNDISLDISSGKVYGLIGPNGSGKTTLISLITEVNQCSSGVIIKKDKLRIGALINGPSFYNHLSIEENFKVLAKIGDIPIIKIRDTLKLVDLTHISKKKYSHLSLGMKQRMGIASALLNDPDLVILDEPTNGLDPVSIKYIHDIMHKLIARGISILYASHTLTEINEFCSDLILLKKGRIVFKGRKNDFFINQNNQFRISCSDNNLLYTVMKDYPRKIKVKKNEDDCLITVKENSCAEEINNWCISNNVILSKIVVENPSIEESYLKLIK